MKKSRALRRLILMAVTVLIGILLFTIGFNIPFTTYKFTGFYNGLMKSNELEQGIVAIYNIERLSLSSDYRVDVDNTKTIIEDFFGIRNQSVKVTRIGDESLQVEADLGSSVETYLNNIGSYMQLNLRSASDGSREIEGSDIKSITVKRNTSEGGYGAYFEFIESGAEKLETLTGDIASNSGSLYIYGGEDGDTELQTISISEAISTGSLFLSGTMNTYEETQSYVSQYLNGILPVKLSLDSTAYIYLTNPSMDYGLLVVSILFGLFIVGSLAYLIVRYRHLGLVTSLSLLTAFILMVGISSSINIIQVNYFGVFAFALCYLAGYLSNFITLEKIRQEYLTGKKIPASFRIGIKKSLLPMLDINMIPALFGLLLLWWGNLQVKTFGLIFFIGFSVNLLVFMLLNLGLLNTYLTYNSTKPKKINFVRGDVDEIA